jgi:glycine/D-amino acid oxidase-like deaminating enzyme
LWHETAGDDWTPRPALPGDTDVDVAVVGAGLTGLWTAHYLAEADPSLRIAVLEAEVAGYGASGRNGGWCSALFPASLTKLTRLADREAALAQHRAMRETVDEVARATAAEGIDAHVVKGGTISLARNPAQLRRARAEVEDARAWGRDETDVRLLDRAEARRILDGSGTLGGTFTPDCAVVHPGRLVRGLASAVERRGVRIHEQTRVTSIEPGRVRTTHGTVRAETVIRATEGYTAGLVGQRRVLAPVYSLVIATEPLDAELWDRIGLARRETFTDHRHLIVYGQRTADDRLVFGGRGAPYHYGSAVRPTYDTKARVFATLDRALAELLPDGAPYDVTHRWGGPLAISRDWHASVRFDPRTGLASAGGYVGDGVASANLAGRTLADLLLGRTSALTRLPWVGHTSPRWEPEPLRWLGVNAGLRIAAAADATEARSGQPTPVSRALSGLLGRLTGS